MSYLAIEGYHAFVTGALGGIGSAIVEELGDFPGLYLRGFHRGMLVSGIPLVRFSSAQYP